MYITSGGVVLVHRGNKPNPTRCIALDYCTVLTQIFPDEPNQWMRVFLLYVCVLSVAQIYTFHSV